MSLHLSLLDKGTLQGDLFVMMDGIKIQKITLLQMCNFEGTIQVNGQRKSKKYCSSRKTKCPYLTDKKRF